MRFRVGAAGWCVAAVAGVAAAVLVVAGCAAVPHAEDSFVGSGAAYWDRSRLLGALPFRFGALYQRRQGQ